MSILFSSVSTDSALWTILLFYFCLIRKIGWSIMWYIVKFSPISKENLTIFKTIFHKRMLAHSLLIRYDVFIIQANDPNHRNTERKVKYMEELRKKQGFICDMDGVIYHGNKLLPGVKEFVDWLYRENKNFLFLTNSSERSPKELQQKLRRMGLEVDEGRFYTSALATARFIRTQAPGCSA